MLWLVAAILMLIWLVGMLTATTLGGFIHIFAVVSVAVLLIQVTMGHRPA